MLRLLLLACLIFSTWPSVANPLALGEFVVGVIGRGAVASGAVSTAARNAAVRSANGSTISMGRAGRSSQGRADFSWLEQEVASAVIQRVFEGSSTPTQSIQPAPCLVVEFDGHGNYLANYCNSSIDIASFAQQDLSTGAVIMVGCNGCSIQPGELMFFSPLAATGPFVAAQYRVNEGVSSTSIVWNSGVDRNPQIQPQRLQAGVALEASVLKASQNGRSASAVVEVLNSSPISVGLVVSTRSIWEHARASLFTECGGKYEFWNSPYDGFAGLSKNSSSPTWIPPGGKAVVSLNANTLIGQDCKLSHLVIDAIAFRPGQPNGQPTAIYAIVPN